MSALPSEQGHCAGEEHSGPGLHFVWQYALGVNLVLTCAPFPLTLIEKKITCKMFT